MYLCVCNAEVYIHLRRLLHVRRHRSVELTLKRHSCGVVIPRNEDIINNNNHELYTVYTERPDYEEDDRQELTAG